MNNRIAAVAGYLVLYVILDWISYIHPVLPVAITPWNPPPGLSLVFLLRYGTRYWPALFLAALLAEILVRGIPAPLPWLAASSLALAGCYAGLAALLGTRIGARFDKLSDLTRFLALILPGTLVAALAYVAIFTFAGLVPQHEFFPNLLRFWVGDAIGVMVVTPLLLVHGAENPALWRSLRPQPEMLAQAAAVLAALWLIFGVEYSDEFKFFYLLFLPLIWIAMRHGIRGATIAILGIQLGLIVALEWSGQRSAAVVEFQLLMAALTVTGLFLGMAVTSRRALEEQLRNRQSELNQALRMAAAGEMTSALAHELNQPLSAISSYLRACQLMLELPEEQHPLLAETMDKVVAEAARAGQVVHRLRDFYRSGELRLERLAMEPLLQGGMEPLNKRADREGIALSLKVAPHLPEVLADRMQIETVLHNLVSNAIDACGASRRGEIHVGAVAEGGAVRVCVSDNGAGIAPEIAAHLFKPFATSKPQGMGLGLAITRSLIEAHGGKLWAEAGEGGGARFCFTLPAEFPTIIAHGR
ncbi:MAG: MASE1 domain-containing protein [Sulfuricella sp.]|nr:MASE1 domain-containing protein [Sulfuricella sp.]